MYTHVCGGDFFTNKSSMCVLCTLGYARAYLCTCTYTYIIIYLGRDVLWILYILCMCMSMN